MTADALLEVLIAEIESGNKAFVNDLLAQARAKIMKGKGEIAPFQSGTLNGKTIQRGVVMNAVEVARVCRLALAQDAGDLVSSTSLDFSEI